MQKTSSQSKGSNMAKRKPKTTRDCVFNFGSSSRSA